MMSSFHKTQHTLNTCLRASHSYSHLHSCKVANGANIRRNAQYVHTGTYQVKVQQDIKIQHQAASRLILNWDNYRDQFAKPSTNTFGCWNPESYAPLNDSRGNATLEDVPPLLMPSLLRLRAESSPNDVALSVFRDGDWQKTTYSEYYENTRIVAKAFIELGLDPFCSVNPIGFNSPEHYTAFQAAPMAGGFFAGIYPTNR